jgi:predicted alpha/beta-fold hydrolase
VEFPEYFFCHGCDLFEDEKYHVHGAAVAGMPFDHEHSYPFVNAQGIRRALVQHCNGNAKFDHHRAMAATTTSYEWEDAFFAPVYGFTDFIDYYRQTSCMQFLENIAVPTFILSAADDPLFNPSVFPQEKSVKGGRRAPLKMVRTNHGGPLGYAFGSRRAASWMPIELAMFI